MNKKVTPKLEVDIRRVLTNTNPVRSPDGMLKEIMRLIKEEK